MKALIRNTEIWQIPQTMQENEIIWQSSKFPNGNGYALAEDVPEGAIASDYDITEVIEIVEEGEETVERIRLKATLNRARYDARKAEEAQE